MSRIRPQCLDADCSDRSARSDVLRREEPDEEEDDEKDEGNVTDDEGDDEDEDDGGYSVRVCRLCQWRRMKREDFVKVAEETLDSLPEEFQIRIQNVAILVEDFSAVGLNRILPIGFRSKMKYED
jgi:hypothetical protein